jgi:hypothetical protein
MFWIRVRSVAVGWDSKKFKCFDVVLGRSDGRA